MNQDIIASINALLAIAERYEPKQAEVIRRLIQRASEIASKETAESK